MRCLADLILPLLSHALGSAAVLGQASSVANASTARVLSILDSLQQVDKQARVDKRNKQILAALGLGIPAFSALALWLLPRFGGQAGSVTAAVTALLIALPNFARAVSADGTDTKTAVRAADS